MRIEGCMSIDSWMSGDAEQMYTMTSILKIVFLIGAIGLG